MKRLLTFAFFVLILAFTSTAALAARDATAISATGNQTTNPVYGGGSTNYGTTASNSVNVTFGGGGGTCTATLSVISGLPAGATPTFAPSSVAASGSGTQNSLLSIAVAAGTTPGTYTFTVQAANSTAGGCADNSTVTDTQTLVVGNSPTMVKAFNPTSVAVNGTSTMTIVISNANAATVTGVAVSDTFPTNLKVATPNGSGNTCNGTFTATAGSGSVSLTGGSIAAHGSCTLTVNVTSATAATYVNTTGNVSSTNNGTGATATATLTVATPATITAVALGTQTPNPVTSGSSATYSVTATWAGTGTCTSIPLVFNGALPSGATASFSPTTVSTGTATSTLTIATTGSTPVGTTTGLSVTATSTGGTGSCGTSSITSSTTSLVVNAPRTITAVAVGTQTPNPVNPPSSATYTITATFAGNGTCTSNALVFNGSLPSGSTASFSPTTVTSAVPTSTLTITTNGTSSASTTPFTVTASTSVGANNCGTSSSNSSSASFVINGNTILTNVVGTQTPNPVSAGSSATFSITTTWSGGAVCTSAPLSINWTAPTGATAVFGPTTVSSTAATSTLTISSTSATPAGSTNFTVTAASTGGTGNCGTSSIISTSHAYVVQTPSIITGVTVGTQTPSPAPQGSSATYSITTTWTGSQTCTPIVTVDWNPGAPAGVTTGFSPTLTSVATTSTLTVSTTAATPAGTTPFTVTVTSTGGAGACGTGSVTSSGSALVVQAVTIGTYTEPFNTSHGWTYTQLTCTGGTCSNSAAVTVAADCQNQPCVSATITDSFATAKTMTGYFHNPAGYTWQTVGVPANATVTAVKGAWWDLVTQSGSGCDTSADTTAGIKIFNAANSAEITTPSVFADTGVDTDTAAAGVTHTGATAATVSPASSASSTGITIRFDINPSFTAAVGSGTCNIFGDNLNLFITYIAPGSGRHGQVIIGFTRTPDGNFRISTPTYTASPLANADQPNDASNSAIISKRDE